MKRIWKDKQGNKHKIKEMETQHIRNCIALLKRFNDHRLLQAESFGAFFHGEQAIFSHEEMMRGLYDHGFEDDVDDYIFSFEQELEKRIGGK